MLLVVQVNTCLRLATTLRTTIVQRVVLDIRTREQVRVAVMNKMAVFVILGMKEGTVPLAPHVNFVHLETLKPLRVMQTVVRVQTLSNRVMIV